MSTVDLGSRQGQAEGAERWVVSALPVDLHMQCGGKYLGSSSRQPAVIFGRPPPSWIFGRPRLGGLLSRWVTLLPLSCSQALRMQSLCFTVSSALLMVFNEIGLILV